MGLFSDQESDTSNVFQHIHLKLWTCIPHATGTHHWSTNIWIQIHDCPTSKLWLWTGTDLLPSKPISSKWKWTEWAAVGPDGCLEIIISDPNPAGPLCVPKLVCELSNLTLLTTKDTTAKQDSEINPNLSFHVMLNYRLPSYKAGHDWALYWMWLNTLSIHLLDSRWQVVEKQCGSIL